MNIKNQLSAALLLTLVATSVGASEPTRSVSVDHPDRLRTGGWAEIEPGVFQSENDGVATEAAFGRAALSRAVEHLNGEIESLADRRDLSLEEILELSQLELRRAELEELALRAASKAEFSEIDSICFGWSELTHEYGFIFIFNPFVRALSRYTEAGPLSFGRKTTYASARICGDGVVGCETGGPDVDTVDGQAFNVTSETMADVLPALSCRAKAFGYVLVEDSAGCTDIKSLSTEAACTDF